MSTADRGGIHRAAAVVSELTAKHGIPATRLKAAGVGNLSPVTPDDGEKGRAGNWRAELVKHERSCIDKEASVKQLTSSLLVWAGLLVLLPTLSASHAEAGGAPSMSSAAQLSATTAAEDHVVLERRFNATRGPCTPELGVPTNRVFPDGTRELFVVPAGKAFVLTDLEGEITETLGATWFVGTIGTLNATLTGAVANQYVRARAPLDAAAVSAGIATLKLHLESGVVADSGAAVCLSAIVLESNGFRSASVGTDVRVHGYLIAR